MESDFGVGFFAVARLTCYDAVGGGVSSPKT